MLSRWSRRLPPVILGASFALVAPVAAQDFERLSKDERKQFLSAHAELGAIDEILAVCNELAPDYASANQAILAEFKASRSIEQVGSLVERYVSWLKGQNAGAEAALALTGALMKKAVRASLVNDPDKCGEAFRFELFDTEFEHLAAIQETHGLEAAGDAVAEATPTPADPAPEAALERPAEPAQPAMTTPTHDVGMPAPVADRVDELPGIDWAAIDGVDQMVGGGAFCVWRCVVLRHGERSYPWLLIHEAVPLGADDAIEQMFALTDEYAVLGLEDVDAGDLASGMRMQPDRVGMRRASVERFGSVYRHMIFAIEKNGLTTIAQLHYDNERDASPEAEKALSQLILGLQVDQDLVLAALAENPAGMTIEAARGAPPEPGQVIYAETPDPTHNTLTLSLSYADDARYLEAAVLDSEGPVIDVGDTPYYYVPPQPEGAAIEGVFKSADGYAGVGISVLKSETLVFGKNGRYATSAASGVLGGLASTGSSSQGEGSYRIDGYTLELRSDDGVVHEDVFFPYMSRTFWPGSDGPADEFNFINLGGKILYRDDG